MGDRHRARLLAALLLALAILGFASAIVQLVLVPGFLPVFLTLTGAVIIFMGGYALSRTRRFRWAAGLAAFVPVVACLASVAANADDRVWFAFMMVSVLFGTIFFSTTTAGLIAAGVFAAVALAAWLVPSLRQTDRWVSILAFHAVFSPLLLLAAAHRDRIERDRAEDARRREVAMAETNRLETLGQLAGSVAHDFHNLLTIILGNVSLVAAGGENGGPARLKEIQLAADRATSLTGQLLTFGRRQPSVSTTVNLNVLLETIRPLLDRLAEPHVCVALDCYPALWPVEADPAQVEQIVLNLVANARDAMPAGGTVTISTVNLTVDEPKAGGPSPGEHVVLSVTDTGLGMDAATRARIFEPYFTTKEAGGTGLGLATVHGIVKQSRGYITVDSAPGQGTTFRITLPRSR